MLVIATLLILILKILVIWKARPSFRFQELRRHEGRRLRCSILAEVFVALVEVFGLLWRYWHQLVLILALPDVLDQS